MESSCLPGRMASTMRIFIVISYLLTLVALGAVGDGLNNSGVQTWGHLLNALEIAGLFLFLIVFKITTWRIAIICLISYTCFRVFGFDYLRNIVAGQELFYMGGDNWWDMSLVKQHPGGLLFARVLFLALGIGLTIKEANGISI